jgi:hypothetical protein
MHFVISVVAYCLCPSINILKSAIQKNLQYRNKVMNNPMPTSGAYFRMRAWRLMFLAALRYFADSERSEVDRWDIPG